MLRLICLLSDIVVQDSISSTEELLLSTSKALGKVDSYTYSGSNVNKDGEHIVLQEYAKKEELLLHLKICGSQHKLNLAPNLQCSDLC